MKEELKDVLSGLLFGAVVVAAVHALPILLWMVAKVLMP